MVRPILTVPSGQQTDSPAETAADEPEQKEEDYSVKTGIAEIKKHGNLVLETKGSEFFEKGYEYGLVLAKKPVSVRCIGEDMNTVGYYIFVIDILHKCIDDAWTEGVLGTGFSWGLEGFVVWSNRDVFHSTDYEPLGSLAGTLYLAASDPIPVPTYSQDWLQNFWTGVALGLCGKALSWKAEQKEPAVCLYGYESNTPSVENTLKGYYVIVDSVRYVGRVLPNINVLWNKNAFPYAYILTGGVVFFCDTEMRYNSANDMLYMPVGTNYRYHMWYEKSSEYSDGLNRTAEEEKNFSLDETCWASHAITDENGTIVREATVPVPVGEIFGYSDETVLLPNVETAWTDELKAEYSYAHVERDLDSKMWYLFITTTPAYSYSSNFMNFRAGTEYRFGPVKGNEWDIYTSISGHHEDGPLGTLPTAHEVTWVSYDTEGYSMTRNNLTVPVSLPVYERSDINGILLEL
jgi:hypothetical protein